jgi:hypothetical protein
MALLFSLTAKIALVFFFLSILNLFIFFANKYFISKHHGNPKRLNLWRQVTKPLAVQHRWLGMVSFAFILIHGYIAISMGSIPRSGLWVLAPVTVGSLIGLSKTFFNHKANTFKVHLLLLSITAILILVHKFALGI